eukprot:scaffold2050_cov148-Isochrysis_galbana.AAC.1
MVISGWVSNRVSQLPATTNHIPHATGRTHSLQTHHPPRPHHHHPRKRTHPPIRLPMPHVRAQKRKLLAHGGMQRDPQIIYATARKISACPVVSTRGPRPAPMTFSQQQGRPVSLGVRRPPRNGPPPSEHEV